MNIARPVLVSNTVTSPNANDKTCKFSFGGTGSVTSPTTCAVATCTTYTDQCNALSSAPTRTSAGNYTWTTTGWKPSSHVHCDCTGHGGLDGFFTGPIASDGSGNLVGTSRSATTAGTLSDDYQSCFCIGERQ